MEQNILSIDDTIPSGQFKGMTIRDVVTSGLDGMIHIALRNHDDPHFNLDRYALEFVSSMGRVYASQSILERYHRPLYGYL